MISNPSYITLTALLFMFFIIACKKGTDTKEESDKQVPASVIAQIGKMGFDTSSIISYGEGYLVENDIFIAKKDLENDFSKSPVLRIGKTEQYRTTNLVTGIPRIITK